MKRSLDNVRFDNVAKKTKASEPLSLSYFLPINSGLTYSSVIGFRVIEGVKDCPPNIQDFHTLKEAEDYVKISEKRRDYLTLRALVTQDGFYLDDINGKIIDIITNKKYKFVPISRVSELDLNYLDYQPIFKMC